MTLFTLLNLLVITDPWQIMRYEFKTLKPYNKCSIYAALSSISISLLLRGISTFFVSDNEYPYFTNKISAIVYVFIALFGIFVPICV